MVRGSTYILPEDTLILPENTLQGIEQNSSSTEKYLPMDSLWRESAFSVEQKEYEYALHLRDSQGTTISLFALIFFLAIIFFSREIFSIMIFMGQTVFRLKNQFRNEEKLSYTSQRNLTAFIFSAFFPLLLSLLFGDVITDYIPLSKSGVLFASLAAMAGVWLVRKVIFNFLSWITRDKNTFRLVERISYNHIIISVLLAFPLMTAMFLLPDIELLAQLKVLICCFLLVYILFLIRSYQIIITNHYSHFFIILYLCTLEFLPTALFANYILSL